MKRFQKKIKYNGFEFTIDVNMSQDKEDIKNAIQILDEITK